MEMNNWIIFLIFCLMFIPVGFGANDVAVNSTGNNSFTETSATWSELSGKPYTSNLTIPTGTGVTTVIVSFDSRVNYTTAYLFARVKRDSVVISQVNITGQALWGSNGFVTTVASETEATHTYGLEVYSTAGRKGQIASWNMSVLFIKSGSFAASVTNVTATSPITSTYGATPNIDCPTCITNTTAQITRTQVTGQETIDTTQNTSITNIEAVNVAQNATESALQANDTYFNGSTFPNSTNFRNDSAVQTSTYSGNFPNNTVASKEATWDAKEPAISQGVSPQFWMFNKTWQNITTTWITEGVNLWFTNARAISAVQSILDTMNTSSNTNNTASQDRDNAINSTKANKTNIGEFTAGTVLDSLLPYSLNGTNTTALAANTTANNTNATLTSHVAATGTAVHGLGNVSVLNLPLNDSSLQNGTLFVKTTNGSYILVGNVTFTRTAINNGTSGNLTYNSTTGIFNFNTTSCNDPTTSKLLSDGTNITCGTDQTSAFSLNIVGGEAVTGAAILSQGTGIIITQNGNNFTFDSMAASVTNGTVNPHNLNGSNITSGAVDFGTRVNNVSINLTSRTNVTGTINLTGGADVRGALPDANLASTFVKTVGATSPCTSTGGQNPSISCTYPTNVTVDFHSGNASNLTQGVLPNASIPPSAANLSKNNTFTGTGTTSFAGKVGIGTTSPTRPLSIKADSNAYNMGFLNNTGIEKSYIYSGAASTVWQATTGNDIRIIGTGGSGFVIDINSNVGIGTTNTTSKFQVGNSGDGTQAWANSWNVYSSQEYKTNITNMSNENISETLPNFVSYEQKDDLSGQKQYGVLAEDMPVEVVATDPEHIGVNLYSYITWGFEKIKRAIVNLKTNKLDKVGDNAIINDLRVSNNFTLPLYNTLPQNYPVGGLAINKTDKTVNVMNVDGWYKIQATKR